MLVLTIPMAGCVDYLNHRDTITLAAGDAPKANMAIQTIDPWPYAAGKKSIDYDGQYAKKRIDAYVLPASPGGGNGPVTVNVNQGSSGTQ